MRWWKIIAGLVFAAAICIGLIQTFRTPLIWRAFDRAVARNVVADATQDLPDGLHVYMCGTGSPMPDNQRAEACIGVLAGNQSFIFDAGSGGIHKLGRMGFPMGHVQGAFLTHLHSDHIDGLGQLLMMAWIGQNGFRAEPLPVYGPEGTEIVVGGFNAAYSLDRGYRIAHHGPDIAKPEGYGGRAVEILLPDEPSASKIVYDQDGVRITAIRVNHHSVSPAFGYRIDYKDRSISLSGDTIYHPGFATASEGVDVMFHEALNSEMVTRMADTLSGSGRDVTAKLLRDAMEDHSSPEDAARAASEAGATELIYYHIVPPLPAKALSQIWLGDAKSVFSGKVTLGEDGMLISLPAGSTKIIRSRKF